MKTVKDLAVIAALAGMIMSLGCSSSPPPPPPVGFSVVTTYTLLNSQGRPSTIRVSGVDISADHQQDRPDLGAVQGNETSFRWISGVGARFLQNARAAANWRFSEHNGDCAGQSITLPVRQREELGIDCAEIGSFIRSPFSAQPSAIDLDFPPPFVTVTGGGIDATYGMPAVDFYNGDGELLARAYAYEVAPDGTWLRAYTPDLSSAQTGSYLLLVSNIASDGNLASLATVPINVFTFEPPPPPPDSDPCPYSSTNSQMAQPICNENNQY
jgi:hypothetical protein